MHAVEVSHLQRDFGAVCALRDLSFSVGRGEVYGLVGPDGAGKTTALRVLAGLIVPDAGEVRFAEGATLGYVAQQHTLYGDLTVEENLRFFGRLFGLRRRVQREREARLLEVTSLAAFRDFGADTLSGGMYKKLAIACALLHEPTLLVLDEPTNGVDPIARRELWALLRGFLANGMTVVVSTPYMDEAERCHRVGLLHEGRLLAEGTPTALRGAFADETYEIVGGERAPLLQALDACPDVVTRSPAGARLRAVVTAGGGPRVAAAVAPLGGHLQPVRPQFEDVFVSMALRNG